MVINNNIKNKLQTSITLAVNWAVTEIDLQKVTNVQLFMWNNYTHFT
jgi:hypothetical protein